MWAELWPPGVLKQVAPPSLPGLQKNKNKSFIPKQWYVCITSPQLANNSDFTINCHSFLSLGIIRFLPHFLFDGVTGSHRWHERVWLQLKRSSFDHRQKKIPVRTGGCRVQAVDGPTVAPRTEWVKEKLCIWGEERLLRQTGTSNAMDATSYAPASLGTIHQDCERWCLFPIPLINWKKVPQASWTWCSAAFRVRVTAVS